MGFSFGRVVIFAEKAANDGKENENEVEGIPAFFNGLGFEDVGSERVQRGHYDEDECECCDEEQDDEGGGGDDQRVRAAEMAAVGTVGLKPER